MIFKNDFLVDTMGVLKSILSFRKRRLNGFAILVFAVVRSNAKEHTIEHERVHIRQFWRNPVVYIWKSIFNRYYLELEAYKVSIEYGRDVDSAARALSIYNDGDIETAKKDLLS